MPSNFLSPGFVLDQNQAVPSVTPDGIVSWRGQSMAPLAVSVALNGQVYAGPGSGSFPLRLNGKQGTLDVQFTAGSEILAVAATGTLVTVGGALLVDGETFTLSDGVNTPVVFEFDSNAAITGDVAVTFTGGDSVATVRTAIVSAINGVGAGLALTASPGTPGQILLVNDATGAVGNVTITDTVADAGFTHTGMAGGVTAGPERTVLYLTDNITTPTNYILLAVDNLDRPLIRIKNNAGTSVAVVTPSTATISPGAAMSVRVTWDAVNFIPGFGRHASMKVNGVFTQDADWTTNPLAAWNSFIPTYLVVGQGLGAASDFNGILGITQVANVVSP